MVLYVVNIVAVPTTLTVNSKCYDFHLFKVHVCVHVCARVDCGLWTGLCADHVMLMWLVVTPSPDFNLSLCL